MSRSLAIVITKPPFGSVHAAEAIRLANGAVSFGHRVTIILTGDGVYVAKKGQKAEEAGWTSLSPILEKLVSGGQATALVDQDSATRQGITANDLPKGVELAESSRVFSAITNAERSAIF